MRLPIEVVLLGAPACHFCDDAQVLLNELGTRMPLAVRKVELHSEEGRALAVEHRIPFPPLVLVNGKYFGHGRISARKLERHLDSIDITTEVH
jgi:glutaredoxin